MSTKHRRCHRIRCPGFDLPSERVGTPQVFPGIAADAAALLLERGVVGIGIDTLSPDGGSCAAGRWEFHNTILAANRERIILLPLAVPTTSSLQRPDASPLPLVSLTPTTTPPGLTHAYALALLVGRLHYRKPPSDCRAACTRKSCLRLAAQRRRRARGTRSRLGCHS